MSADKVTNPILEKTAEGDESISYNIAIDDFNRPILQKIDRKIKKVLADPAINYSYALRLAAKNGRLGVVNALLEMTKVAEANTAAANYLVLHLAAAKDLAAANHLSLYLAAANGHLDVVNRLLEIPGVAANAGTANNRALRFAAENGHFEISYMLAELQWLRGKINIPANLHKYLPQIRKGEQINAAKIKFEGTVKSCRRNRCEPINEGRADSHVDTLLYSSNSHKTFQSAYEKGQKKSSGYDDAAMVEHKPSKPKSSFM